MNNKLWPFLLGAAMVNMSYGFVAVFVFMFVLFAWYIDYRRTVEPPKNERG